MAKKSTSNPKVTSALILVSAVSLVAAGISGCKVGPDYKAAPEVRVPGSYGSVTDGKVVATKKSSDLSSGGTSRPASTQPDLVGDLTKWWKAFDDAQLTSLIDRAVVGNLDVKQAEARLRQSRAFLGISEADLYPSVDANGNVTRNRTSKTMNESGSSFGKTESTTWRAGLDASWEIDVFGGVRRGVEAAQADIQAASEDRNAVLTSLAAEVATNYVQLRGAQQRIRIAQDNIESQKQTLSLNEARFNAGISSEFDVARARAQVATFEATIPPLRISEAQAIHRIGVLLGESPAALKDELLPPKGVPMALPTVPVGLPSELLKRRPDIRQAERQLAGQSARIGVATADLFPRFSLTGSFGTQTSKFARIGDSRSLFYSIGPAVSWNVFDAGKIRNQIKVQSEIQSELLSAYESTILKGFEEVENAVVSYSRNVERREALSRSVEANRRSVELATGRFAGGQGVGNLLDVLDAQRNLFSAEDSLVSSETDLSQNMVSLYKALGGGWEPFPEKAPTTAPTTAPAVGNMAAY